MEESPLGLVHATKCFDIWSADASSDTRNAWMFFAANISAERKRALRVSRASANPHVCSSFYAIETQLDITTMTWMASLRCSRLTTHADLGEESKNRTTELYFVSRASGTPCVVGFRQQTRSPTCSRRGQLLHFISNLSLRAGCL